MPKRRILTLLVMMLTAVAPFALGQERDFGELEMDSIQAKKAGIGHIRMVRHGPEENQAEWVLNVDVFDLERNLSGAVELRYPEPDAIEVDFAPAGSDALYRVRVNEAEPKISIEHVGVETVTFRPLCNPAELSEKGKTRYTNEELEELLERKRECSQQVEVTGTSKSWEEATEQYQGTVAYLIVVHSRVKEYFGLLTTSERELQERLEQLQRESQERREQLERESSGGISGAGFNPAPQNFIRCPPEEDPYCPFGNNSYAVLGEGSCFFCDKSECCTEASELADVDCLLNTFSSCCANTLCKVTSLTNCGALSWCACQLIGYFWGCRHCV